MAAHALAASILAVLLAGCSAAPRGAYFPPPGDPHSARVAHVLHRAAVAAGDEPERYSFGFIASPVAVAASDEEATFYVTEGLARQPLPVLEAAIAHEVAHEVLGHVGTRRMLSMSLSAGFTVLGFFFPGTGLIDFVASPLAIRAFTRRAGAGCRSAGGGDPPGDGPRRAAQEPRPGDPGARRRQGAAEGGAPGAALAAPGLEERLDALEPLESDAPAVARGRPRP